MKSPRLRLAAAAIAAFACLALPAAAAPAVRTADDQLRFADGIYLRGLHENAVHEYIAFARDFPADPRMDRVFYRLGECYRRLGNENAALRFYHRVAQDFPASPFVAKAALRRAEFAIAGGRFDEAKILLEPLRAAPPADPEDASAVRYYLARALRGLGDTPAAEALFLEVLAANPPSTHAAWAALELAGLAADDPSPDRRAQVESWLALAVERAPAPTTRAEALFRWGHWAYRHHDWQAAIDAYQQLQTEFPQDTRSRGSRLEAAWCRTHLDQPAEALVLADEAYQQASDAPSAAAALYLRAKLLAQLGRDADAISDFRNLVRLYPNTPSVPFAAYEWMCLLFRRGDHEDLLALPRFDPDPAHAAEVLWMRASANASLDRTDLARGLFQDLARDFPDSPRAPMARIRLAEIARDQGRTQEAADAFRALADSADAPADLRVTALQEAAVAHDALQLHEDAVRDWDALLALSPPPDPATLAEARFFRALDAIRAGHPRPEALEDFRAVAASDAPGAPRAQALYWQGVLLSQSDQPADAERAFLDALAAAPDAKTDALSRMGLVMVLQQLNRLDEAADQAALLLADPETVAAHPDLVEWLVGRRIDQERYPEALAAARALADAPVSDLWRQIGAYQAGLAAEALGDEAAALDAYRAAADSPAQSREGALARLRLAALHLAAGRPDDAARLYADAAETTDDDSADLRARAYFGLGEAAEAAGRADEAARDFMTVGILFDDPELTPHALSRAAALYGSLGKTREKESAEADLRARYPRSSFTRALDAAKTAPAAP